MPDLKVTEGVLASVGLIAAAAGKVCLHCGERVHADHGCWIAKRKVEFASDADFLVGVKDWDGFLSVRESVALFKLAKVHHAFEGATRIEWLNSEDEARWAKYQAWEARNGGAAGRN